MEVGQHQAVHERAAQDAHADLLDARERRVEDQRRRVHHRKADQAAV
jgi:hypothetical protein